MSEELSDADFDAKWKVCTPPGLDMCGDYVCARFGDLHRAAYSHHPRCTITACARLERRASEATENIKQTRSTSHVPYATRLYLYVLVSWLTITTAPFFLLLLTKVLLYEREAGLARCASRAQRPLCARSCARADHLGRGAPCLPPRERLPHVRFCSL